MSKEEINPFEPPRAREPIFLNRADSKTWPQPGDMAPHLMFVVKDPAILAAFLNGLLIVKEFRGNPRKAGDFTRVLGPERKYYIAQIDNVETIDEKTKSYRCMLRFVAYLDDRGYVTSVIPRPEESE